MKWDAVMQKIHNLAWVIHRYNNISMIQINIILYLPEHLSCICSAKVPPLKMLLENNLKTIKINRSVPSLNVIKTLHRCYQDYASVETGLA